MNKIIFSYINEEVQSILEGRMGKTKQLKKDLEKENFGDSDSMFKKAAEIIQKKSDKKAMPGNIPMTIKDIIHILKELSDDKEFMSNIKTPEQLANEAIQVCYDVIELANAFIKTSVKQTKYSGEMAYQIDDRKEIVDAIKTSLKAISAFLNLKLLIEEGGESHTLAIRKLLNKITTKANEIVKKIDSLENDIASKDSKVKANAISESKKIESKLGHDYASKVKKALKAVQKYSGSSSVIWPTLKVTLKNGDKYESLFKYLDAFVAGQDKGHFDKFMKGNKAKQNADIKKKIVVEKSFRQQLKEAAKKNKIGGDKSGANHSISELQSIAKELMKKNPDFLAELKREGTKETAIDEIVGLLSTFIKHGKYDVKVE